MYKGTPLIAEMNKPPIRACLLFHPKIVQIFYTSYHHDSRLNGRRRPSHPLQDSALREWKYAWVDAGSDLCDPVCGAVRETIPDPHDAPPVSPYKEFGQSDSTAWIDNISYIGRSSANILITGDWEHWCWQPHHFVVA
jgi:hypothetical protein